jgi:hypothetical protein
MSVNTNEAPVTIHVTSLMKKLMNTRETSWGVMAIILGSTSAPNPFTSLNNGDTNISLRGSAVKELSLQGDRGGEESRTHRSTTAVNACMLDRLTA